MMRHLQTEGEALYQITYPANREHYGCHSIIDDIIAWSTCQLVLTNYLECMQKNFLKLLLSLKMHV